MVQLKGKNCESVITQRVANRRKTWKKKKRGGGKYCPDVIRTHILTGLVDFYTKTSLDDSVDALNSESEWCQNTRIKSSYWAGRSTQLPFSASYHQYVGGMWLASRCKETQTKRIIALTISSCRSVHFLLQS